MDAARHRRTDRTRSAGTVPGALRAPTGLTVYASRVSKKWTDKEPAAFPCDFPNLSGWDHAAIALPRERSA